MIHKCRGAGNRTRATRSQTAYTTIMLHPVRRGRRKSLLLHLISEHGVKALLTPRCFNWIRTNFSTIIPFSVKKREWETCSQCENYTNMRMSRKFHVKLLQSHIRYVINNSFLFTWNNTHCYNIKLILP